MNMSCSIVLVVIVVIGATSGSVIMPAQDLEVSNGSTAVQVYTDVVEKFESSTDGFLVTPFDYKAVMSQIGSKTMRCWTCSSPCSGTRCCDNGYPQCCRVNGVCGCCRFSS